MRTLGMLGSFIIVSCVNKQTKLSLVLIMSALHTHRAQLSYNYIQASFEFGRDMIVFIVLFLLEVLGLHNKYNNYIPPVGRSVAIHWNMHVMQLCTCYCNAVFMGRWSNTTTVTFSLVGGMRSKIILMAILVYFIHCKTLNSFLTKFYILLTFKNDSQSSELNYKYVLKNINTRSHKINY